MRPVIASTCPSDQITLQGGVQAEVDAARRHEKAGLYPGGVARLLTAGILSMANSRIACWCGEDFAEGIYRTISMESPQASEGDLLAGQCAQSAHTRNSRLGRAPAYGAPAHPWLPLLGREPSSRCDRGDGSQSGTRDPPGNASRNCRSIHTAVGWAVTFWCTILRVPTLQIKSPSGRFDAHRLAGHWPHLYDLAV